MATALGVGTLVTLGAGMVLLMSYGLEKYLPPLTIDNEIMRYSYPDPKWMFLPLLIVPVFLLPQLVRSAKVIDNFLVHLLVLGGSAFILLPLFHHAPPIFIALLILLARTAVIALLAHTCKRKDLVAQ